MVNASEPKPYTTTVKTYAPFPSWTSQHASIITRGMYSNKINPIDGLAGVLNGKLKICRCYGQKQKDLVDAKYVKPYIGSAMKRIKVASLWNYRAFKLDLFDLKDKNAAKSTPPHEESLCERCQEDQKNCVSHKPLETTAKATKVATTTRGGVALSRGRGGAALSRGRAESKE